MPAKMTERSKKMQRQIRLNYQTTNALLEARRSGKCRICGAPAVGVTCAGADCLGRWLILPEAVDEDHEEGD